MWLFIDSFFVGSVALNHRSQPSSPYTPPVAGPLTAAPAYHGTGLGQPFPRGAFTRAPSQNYGIASLGTGKAGQITTAKVPLLNWGQPEALPAGAGPFASAKLPKVSGAAFLPVAFAKTGQVAVGNGNSGGSTTPVVLASNTGGTSGTGPGNGTGNGNGPGGGNNGNGNGNGGSNSGGTNPGNGAGGGNNGNGVGNGGSTGGTTGGTTGGSTGGTTGGGGTPLPITVPPLVPGGSNGGTVVGGGGGLLPGTGGGTGGGSGGSGAASIAPVPVPAAGLLLVGGMAALGGFARRKRA